MRLLLVLLITYNLPFKTYHLKLRERKTHVF